MESDNLLSMPFSRAARAVIACHLGYSLVVVDLDDTSELEPAGGAEFGAWDRSLMACAGYYATIKGHQLSLRSSEIAEVQVWINCKFEVAEILAGAGYPGSPEFYEDRRLDAIALVDASWAVIEHTAALLRDVRVVPGTIIADALAAA